MPNQEDCLRVLEEAKKFGLTLTIPDIAKKLRCSVNNVTSYLRGLRKRYNIMSRYVNPNNLYWLDGSKIE